MAGISCKYHPEAMLIEDYRAGDQICGECGLVVGDRVIDVSAEWRTFDQGVAADKSRVGGALNPLLDGSDLSTITVGGDNRGHGPSDPNRTLKLAFREIREMGEKIHLTETVITRANGLFKMVRDKKKLQGRPIEGVSPACLYIACRQESVPRTFKEICAISNASERSIKRYFKTINDLFQEVMQVEAVKSDTYMPRFCTLLQLPHKVQRMAMVIARRATDDLELVPGRAPTSVAAAAIFMASRVSGVNCSLSKIGEVVGVAETTIKTVYKILLPHAKALIPKN